MIVVVAIVVVALVAIVVATMRRRAVATLPDARAVDRSTATDGSAHRSAAWTQTAGDGFSALSESDRCDLIFAIRDLPGDERTTTLRAALDDPSDVVAFAAAAALDARGERALVERYLAERPDERSRRLRDDLSALTGSATPSF